MKIKTRRYYLYYLLKTGFYVLSLIPLRMGLFLAERLGMIAGKIAGKYNNVAMSNLNDVFSDDVKKNKNISEKVFANLAKNGVEWIKLYSMSPDKVDTIISEYIGLQYLDEVLAAGNGALVLGFHFGNWELLGIGLKHKGYPGSLVGRRIYFHKYDKLIVKLRNKFGAKTIYRDESPRKMLRELKEGRILGIVPDQDVDSIDGAFVDFFGKRTFTPTAPVKLAMTAKTKIVPILIVRKNDNTHKMIVEKPIDVTAGNKIEENVLKYTQEWTRVLEKYVRMYPEQWVWLHSRWKTQPQESETVVR